MPDELIKPEIATRQTEEKLSVPPPLLPQVPLSKGQKIVQEWITTHVHNSSLSRDTDLYNTLLRAGQELAKMIDKG